MIDHSRWPADAAPTLTAEHAEAVRLCALETAKRVPTVIGARAERLADAARLAGVAAAIINAGLARPVPEQVEPDADVKRAIATGIMAKTVAVPEQAERIERDAARLDWIDRVRPEIQPVDFPAKQLWCVEFAHPYTDEPTWVQREGTLRSVLDAAMLLTDDAAPAKERP